MELLVTSPPDAIRVNWWVPKGALLVATSVTLAVKSGGALLMLDEMVTPCGSPDAERVTGLENPPIP